MIKNGILWTDDSIPGYENGGIDAGILSGMLTDAPEVKTAAIKWMQSLIGPEKDVLMKLLHSKDFKDMYGERDFFIDQADKARYKQGLDSDKLTPEEVYGYDPAEACMNDVSFNRWLEEQYGVHKSNPTGIANPADYMSSIKVTKTKEDTDGDGDIDKIEVEKKEE